MRTDLMEEGGGRWGTWEELLLGGAVLRHGTCDWNIVASELRARATLCPYDFTPKACKAKYEDLQDRYSGCKALFEELRKKRMAELKQALELSEGSIGSLESKLETLKAEKQDYYHTNDGFSQMGFSKLVGFETSSKETSKDGLSAGSYTLETRTSWSSDCQLPAVISFEETNYQLEASHSPQLGKTSIIEKLAESVCGRQELTIKKKRGKRKRKDCNRDVNEVSVGESSLWDSADAVIAVRTKENTTSDCGEVSRSSGLNDQKNRGSTNDLIDDLMRHFTSVLEHRSASTFQHRLDSQKRGRYKKIIRKHVDFDTLRSRIISGSIISVKELFRDMLLLANNALVFYSKNTREFKSALLLRELTTKQLQQYYNDSRSQKTTPPPPPTLFPGLIIHNPTVKPQGARVPVHLVKRKLPSMAANTENGVAKTSLGAGKPNNTTDSFRSVQSLVMKKKGFGRPRKFGFRNSNQQSITSIKGRR